ncbi:MAG TPA: 16S rRNA (adenine(1518)-N(6)/adenine(1519)-N(6))-dimethyltransferase RsmA [Anaerolineaceae bacterium]|nr:ribosomal RNA small subunit methyltransferase A [Chloroflexota bacterium]HNY84349.1 16S rRNA (adenine(1518)-N(6)/adenine(1519)-N(6))-dimethyltransferase RsmA [Anaerolineaceae bacterium]
MSLKFLDLSFLLKKYAIRPKKSLGQNFLSDPNGLQKVIDAARLSANDEVLEIGAGLGSLTVLLAQLARQVTAIEIDRTLLPALSEAILPYPNIELIEGDILEIPPETLPLADGYVVVANIPYYITSAIIRHLLSSTHKPGRLVMTVQKEVAERILARDGKHSLLSLSVQVYGTPEITAVIPAGCFYPAPDVDSAVIRVSLFPQPAIPLQSIGDFFVLAHAGFAQKRKTLRNSLSAGLKLSAGEIDSLLSAASINPQRRAETLSIKEWNQLTQAFQDFKRKPN